MIVIENTSNDAANILKDLSSGIWFRGFGQRAIFRVEEDTDKYVAYKFVRLDSVYDFEGSHPEKEPVEGCKLYCITDDPNKIVVTKIEGKRENLSIEDYLSAETFWENDPVKTKIFYIPDEETIIPFSEVPEAIKMEMNMPFYDLPKGYLGKRNRAI